METIQERSRRIISELKKKYPNAKAFDLDGSGSHFVSEIEPTEEHPEYDRAIEVIIKSKPHKHLKMTQRYTVLSGRLVLHADDKTSVLNIGDSFTIAPNVTHWAESNDECWTELYSTPGWTQEDHILTD